MNRKQENRELLEYLNELIEQPGFEDMRFGQLIDNATGQTPLFYIESKDLLNKMKEAYK